MAIAFVKATYGAGTAITNAGTNIAPTIATVTAGNFLAICVTWTNAGASNITTVVDSNGGQTWSSGTIQTNGNLHSQIWYLPNANAGTHTVTVTFSASGTSCAASIAEFSGVAASTPLDTQTGATGSSTAAATGSLAPTGTADLFISCFGEPGVSASADFTPDPASGWSQMGSFQAGFTIMGFGSGYLLGSGTTANSAAWTIASSTTWAAAIACFKAAVPLSQPISWISG